MIKPRKGFVTAEVVQKKFAGDLIVAPDAQDNEYKHVIVVTVGEDVEGIKKGDNIILAPTAEAMSITDEKKEYVIVEQSGICAVRV